MALYTDYTSVVTYSSSIATTNSTVSNVVANAFVTYADCTLTTSAAEGADSSATNYAEVKYSLTDYPDLYIRFYGASPLGQVNIYVALTSNGTTVKSSVFDFAAIASTNVTVKLRFYNVLSGLFIHRGNGASWACALWAATCTRISNGTCTYGIYTSYPTSGCAIVVPDGLGATYYGASSSSYAIGVSDADSTRQVMTQLALVTGSSAAYARYIFSHVYSSYTAVLTGLFQIGTRCFYVPLSTTNQPYFTELNA